MYFNRPNPDLAYIYEMFLRRVYHCGRGEDPFEIADADCFSVEENNNLSPDSFVGIWTATNLLFTQVEKDSKLKVQKVKDLIEENPTSKCFKQICVDLFKILDENNINEFPHWNALPYMV